MQPNTRPGLVAANLHYFRQLLRSRHSELIDYSQLFTVPGYIDYNHKVKLNAMFSSRPFGMPMDRRPGQRSPLHVTIMRPWQLPRTSESLSQVLDQRAQELLARPGPINMLWSGGQDSTAMVTALATQCDQHDRLRLLYTPFSIYENASFFDWLRQRWPRIDIVDLSGSVYLDIDLDGTWVTGHGADELMGSLDRSFFEQGPCTHVDRPWQDFVSERCSDQDFVDQCKVFFESAGRPITSLLHARWWFYACCKLQHLNTVNALLFGSKTRVDLDNFLAFYDCDSFESWTWHNLDSVIEDVTDYKTWKKCLRRYVHQHWPDQNYLDNTEKTNSVQLVYYRLKKEWLNDLHWIGILDTGEIVRTPNLPLFSQREWHNTYQGRYDYLWQ